MRLYLDLCALKRPFDHPRDERADIESLAVAFLIGAIDRGVVRAVSSGALELENSRNPVPERRDATRSLLSRFERASPPMAEVARRSAELHAVGFHPVDAVHVASAELGGCDLLVTCDDGILKVARRSPSALRIRIVDPLEAMRLVSEEGLS